MIELPRLTCKELSSKSGAPSFDGHPLQVGMGKCPWRVAVASVLLNRTHVRQARPALRELLSLWPNAASLSKADPWSVSPIVHSCGFGERRTKTLIALSTQWCTDLWTDMRDLTGVGAYVSDAVGLFCFGCTELQSTDPVLKEYALSIVHKQ